MFSQGAATRDVMTLVAEHVEAGLTRGMQVHVSRDTEVLLDAAVGVRGQDDRPLTADTRLAVYSSGKPVTATALHLLADRGLVSHDDPVVRFIPEFGRHGKDGITLRHLLLHQAGIPDLEETIPVSAFDDFAEGIARICDLVPVSGPGERTAYHLLTGIAVVAEVVQRVSGTDLRSFCQSEVFGPLGMTHTTHGVPDDVVDEVSDTVGSTPERAVVADLWRSPQTRRALHPGMGLHSTARDLARFYRAWLQPDVLLSPRTMKQATAVGSPAGAAAGFGLGFMVGVDRVSPGSRGVACSPRTFGHPGMCSAQAYADPDAGLVVVLLANVDIGQEQSDLRFAALCDAAQRSNA